MERSNFLMVLRKKRRLNLTMSFAFEDCQDLLDLIYYDI